MSACLRSAKEWLEELKQGVLPFWFAEEQMRAALELSETTLAEIGSSEQEIDILRRNYCIKQAKDDLKSLRRDPLSVEWSFEASIRSWAEQGGFELSDIETSEEELDELRLKGEVIVMNNRLSALGSYAEHIRLGKKYRGLIESGEVDPAVYPIAEYFASVDIEHDRVHIDRLAKTFDLEFEHSSATYEDLGTSEEDVRSLKDFLGVK